MCVRACRRKRGCLLLLNSIQEHRKLRLSYQITKVRAVSPPLLSPPCLSPHPGCPAASTPAAPPPYPVVYVSHTGNLGGVEDHFKGGLKAEVYFPLLAVACLWRSHVPAADAGAFCACIRNFPLSFLCLDFFYSEARMIVLVFLAWVL